MMMKTRYEPQQIQHGQETLQAFLDDLKALDVLPMPQPAGMEPATYMCADSMDALMVTFDNRRLVCDVGFRNTQARCVQLLGIVVAPGFDTRRSFRRSQPPESEKSRFRTASSRPQ